jgi:hypothetical protein
MAHRVSRSVSRYQRGFAAAIFTFACAIASPAAEASDPGAVALGEVSTIVQRGNLDLRALLRSTLEEELRALDLSRVPRSRHAILSVSLVRMDTQTSQEAESDAAVTTCVVSATLRDARRGAIFAILEGKARGAGGASDGAIVRTAVRGAVARIPEAMRR